jgi:hypothetical protein
MYYLHNQIQDYIICSQWSVSTILLFSDSCCLLINIRVYKYVIGMGEFFPWNEKWSFGFQCDNSIERT